MIGCDPNPKVIDNLYDKEHNNPITSLQAARSGPGANNDPDSRNPVVRQVKALGKLALFQTMENESPEDTFEEVDVKC